MSSNYVVTHHCNLQKRNIPVFFLCYASIIQNSFRNFHWKLLVIYFLSLQEVIRFSQLRRSLPEISERMLVRQLRELEDDGLVSRTVYGTVPPRVDYALTPLGISLVPIMESLKAWGSGLAARAKLNNMLCCCASAACATPRGSSASPETANTEAPSQCLTEPADVALDFMLENPCVKSAVNAN